jgi:PEP-CTERM/exosortase A-associated glycosyltransferase
MSLRILHVLDHSIPLQSGYAFRTCAILREQRRMGWQTFHVTSPKHVAPSDPIDEVDGLSFYRTAWKPGFLERAPVAREVSLMRATKRRVAEVAWAVKPDILHVHSPVLNALPALSVGRSMNIPVLYEVRAFWEDAAVDHGTSRQGGPRYLASRALETFALRRANHVTTICEGLRQDIVARGIPEHKVTVIPNAVDIDAFSYRHPRDDVLRRDLSLEGTTVIGFLGSYYAYEGLDLLIDAIPGIARIRPDVRVMLVGGGPEEEALRAQVQSRGIGDKVLFIGRVPQANVQRYYSLVDLLAYPRRSMRLTELVTPLKPLEAMAQGQLLVASDVGGHRELIRDGETGVLFRAGSVDSLTTAVLDLLSKPDRWDTIRENGRRFVEAERTWKQSVGRYQEVCKRLVR